MIRVVSCLLILAGVQTEPTAEDMLRELRAKRAHNPIIPSATLTEPSTKKPTHRLYPEGYAIVEQSGTLLQDDQWWAIQFDDEKEDQSPTRVLANQQLEVMILTIRSAAAPVTFSVSGEMTVFKNRNYLLIHRAAAQRAKPVQVDPTPKEEGENQNPETDQSIDSVIKSIRQVRESSDEIDTGLLADRANAPDGETAPNLNIMSEGTMLVRRPGRIVRRQNGWMFVFESDHKGHPEPPIMLHPNQTVELMIKTSEQGANGLVFLVTGDVTLFKNRNYLLPRVAIRRIDSGNLRK